MTAVRWQRHPNFSNTVMIAAFGGWNDAAAAASQSAAYMATRWNAQSFAELDSEEFFDFTSSRPIIRLQDKGLRRIDWPETTFAGGITPRGKEIIFLLGNEPQLKWRTFCKEVLDLAQTCKTSLLITLGALLSDVPHTRPAPVTASSGDPSLQARYGFEPSQYEGPTGITGVLHTACQDRHIPSVALWAAVPHYVGNIQSPLATAALIREVTGMLDEPINLAELDDATANYRQQVDEAIESDSDIAHYIQELEAAAEESQAGDTLSADDLAREAERFLRDQDK